MARKEKKSKTIADTVHAEAKRVGIPTEEFADMESEVKPIPLRYPRNPDLDPQLVWKGKDAQDAEDLTVKAMPIYIQEKIHPRNIIEDLKRETDERKKSKDSAPITFESPSFKTPSLHSTVKSSSTSVSQLPEMQ